MLWGCAPRYDPIEPGRTKILTIPPAEGFADSTTCLFQVPPDYDPSHSWPLLMALHGAGSDAEPFLDLWREVASEHAVVLAVPRGNSVGPRGIGRTWDDQAPKVVQQSTDGVRHLVNVDPAEICLVGFSRGGGVALRLALEHPAVFRSVALLGTGFGPDRLAAIRAATPRRGQRVYIGRGSLEPNLARAEEAAEAFRQLGCVVEFTVYPDVGHHLPEPIEKELSRILDFMSGSGESGAL